LSEEVWDINKNERQNRQNWRKPLSGLYFPTTKIEWRNKKEFVSRRGGIQIIIMCALAVLLSAWSLLDKTRGGHRSLCVNWLICTH
jgi:hypothetical protein